ncbi:MAG: helix-turn-helix transcriptional regulator, partial [Schwartzia sp.]|nr:helix-turn-helix transcriptional regulator [Schwartzia sp. (in: firmicutes)]
MIGKIIQEKRKAAGLTQAQVADLLGVSPPAVNRWEKDLCYPDATLLAPLARLLHTNLNELFSFYDSLTDEERKLIVQHADKLLLAGDDNQLFLYMEENLRQ